ncbi:MAG TPA: type I-E CRISPR-associated protein Cse1/CasA [Terrimesophilobacter sp.]|nr:type I-E CRISPR-associated protein Cse1/CasA [Terrimesophilobacter sp.]
MTETTASSFSLLTEPWIVARFRDGSTREVSVRQAFAKADDIVDLGGEVPTQTFAIVRLLLAVLHSALRPVRNPDQVWKALWESREPLPDLVDTYLKEHADRFDLLHAEQPFYQVADLATKSAEVSSLGKLIADVPNGQPFFTTRLKSGVDRISFAEAARWIVHCQAFDPSGIKSGAVGDKRVKDGKGYPIGTGWAGTLGGLLIEGKSLRETLLLNLVLGDPDGEPLSDDDLPLWERAPLGPGEEERGGPTGPADLFTWPSRRIRLAHDGDSVTGVVIANGDPLKPQLVRGVHKLEPMTVWRRSETQEKALKVGSGTHVYMPLEHDPNRMIWRGLSALLPQGIREEQRRNGAKYLPALSLYWLAQMSDKGILPSTQFRTRAIGMAYGVQSATVAEIVDDALSMSSILLAQQGRHLAALALGVVQQTDTAVFQLGVLARNLAIAKGGEPDGPGDRLRELAYFTLDSPFRLWLSRLASATDVLDAREEWYSEARTTLIRLARQAVDASGPSAWVGRENSRTGKLVNTAEAFGWFLREVHRALPDSDAADRARQDEENKEVVQ